MEEKYYRVKSLLLLSISRQKAVLWIKMLLKNDHISSPALTIFYYRPVMEQILKAPYRLVQVLIFVVIQRVVTLNNEKINTRYTKQYHNFLKATSRLILFFFLKTAQITIVMSTKRTHHNFTNTIYT